MTTREKRPVSNVWKQGVVPAPVADDPLIEHASVWTARRLRVISALGVMRSPVNDKQSVETWHVSVAVERANRRATDKEIAHVRLAFGMREAEEDNHEPGMARHLFLPVDPSHRTSCECKINEEQVTEADGHRWSRVRGNERNEAIVCEAWRVGVDADV